jgi:hypothetical protein
MLDGITTQPPSPKIVMLRQSEQRLAQHRPRDTTNETESSEVLALCHGEDAVSARTHAAMSLTTTRHTPTQCQGSNLALLTHPIHLPLYSSTQKPPTHSSVCLSFIEKSRTRPKPQPAHRAPNALDTVQSQLLRPRTPSQRPYRRTTPFTMPCTWQ